MPECQRPEFNPLLVRCSWCHVGPRQRCQVPGTNVLLTPKLHKATHGAHPARWEAVRAAPAGELKPEGQRIRHLNSVPR